MSSPRKLLLVLYLMSLTTACTSSERTTVGKTYATIAQDVARDTERARHENADGIKLIEKGEWGKAEDSFNRALEADVTFGPAHNNLGKVYYAQGKYYMAAWEFQYAIKMMPYHIEPLNNLGLVLETVGKIDEAVKNYDLALALEPGDPQVVGNNVRARIRRGDKDMQVVGLLSQVVMSDTRPEWSQWAREQLTLYRAALPPSTQPVTAPSATRW